VANARDGREKRLGKADEGEASPASAVAGAAVAGGASRGGVPEAAARQRSKRREPASASSARSLALGEVSILVTQARAEEEDCEAATQRNS
jgi:hypothetical protein